MRKVMENPLYVQTNSSAINGLASTDVITPILTCSKSPSFR